MKRTKKDFIDKVNYVLICVLMIAYGFFALTILGVSLVGIKIEFGDNLLGFGLCTSMFLHFLHSVKE